MPGDPAIVGVHIDLARYVEGNIITATLQRLGGRRDTAVTVGYIFTSQAGNEDFATAPTGTITLRADDLEEVISVDTVERASVQGDRTITLTLTDVANGVIDEATKVSTTSLIDFVPPGTKWWLVDPWRSNRPWRGGGGYFNTISNYDKYETQVAYLDCIVGPNMGDTDQTLQSRDLAFGGPPDKPNTIMAKSQLDWTQGYEFSTIFKNTASKTDQNRIIGWVCDWISVGDRTDGAANRATWWNEVASGLHDAYFQAMGKRVVLNCQRIGLDPKWLHARPFHEMQQTNLYRVWESTKGIFRTAFERMIDQYREGAGTHLRVAFSPSKDKRWKTSRESVYQDFGAFSSWAPRNCDYVSMSFHPAGEHNTHAEINKFFNGNTSIYGVNTEVAEWCAANGIPLGPLEWSPRWQSNTIADSVYNWYYREHLWPRHKDIGIVCDAVFDQKTLSKDASAASVSAAGKKNWSEGVDVFKHFWDGKRANNPGYTPPSNLPAEWYPSA